MKTPKEVVKGFMDAQIAGDAGGVLGSLHDDISWTILGSTPYSGTRNKQEMLTEVFAPLAPVMKATIEIVEVLAEGDRAVLRTKAKGQGPTGPYNQNYCFICRVADEKIIEIIEYCDTVMVETAMCGRKLVDK